MELLRETVRGPAGSVELVAVVAGTGLDVSLSVVGGPHVGTFHAEGDADLAAILETVQAAVGFRARVEELPAPWFHAEPEADLTIAHTAQEGTTIRGNTRPWAPAIKGLMGGWKWYGRGGFWYRQQSLGRAEPSVPLERWAERLRAAGATVRVEHVETVAEAEANEIRRRRLLDRAERLSERAAGASDTAESLRVRADRMADVIPLGQPILVGHYSEGRDRRYRARIHDTFQKSYEAGQKAERLERRAVSADRRAAELEPEHVAAVQTLNEQVNAFAALLSTRLKRDVGAMTVHKHHSSAGASREWAMYTVRWPPAVPIPSWDVNVMGALVSVMPTSGGDGMQFNLSRVTAEEAYQHVLTIIPKAEAGAATRTPTTPHGFGDALAIYARPRIKRATGAKDANASQGFLYGTPSILLNLPGRKRVEIQLGKAPEGSRGKEWWAVAFEDVYTEHPKELWSFDMRGMTIEEAYRAILDRLPKAGK